MQWQEYDGSEGVQKVITKDEATAAPKLEALQALLQRPSENKHVETSSWVSSLHERFGEGGAELVAFETDWTPKEVCVALTYLLFSFGWGCTDAQCLGIYDQTGHYFPVNAGVHHGDEE